MTPSGESIKTDEAFLRLAISRAMRGRGTVEPNPMVGCVLVKDGVVIGEGHHARPGGPHAEPTALAACAARGSSPAGATAYVTLEPCCHLNKRTPPCVPALISAGVARVVLGAIDPNPDVNGKGIEQLRAAGIEVTTGVCEVAAKQLLAAFTARTVYSRPYVTAKWAETADGFIADANGQPLRISVEDANAWVHTLRARSDAILVGGQTLRADDPLLTARGTTSTPRPLLRVVLTRSAAALPSHARLFQTPHAGQVLVFELSDNPDQVAVTLPNAEVIRVTSIEQLMRVLFERNVAHLMVEPGPELFALLSAGNWIDRLWRIRSDNPLGKIGIPAAAVPEAWVASGSVVAGADTITEWLNTASPVFFAEEPSADLVVGGPR